MDCPLDSTELLSLGSHALASLAGQVQLGMLESLSGLIGAGGVGGDVAHDAAHTGVAIVDGAAFAQGGEAVGSAGAGFLNVHAVNGHGVFLDGEGDALGAGGAGSGGLSSEHEPRVERPAGWQKRIYFVIRRNEIWHCIAKK